jgi:uncharacterized FAD-dependent dehydrogenase
VPILVSNVLLPEDRSGLSEVVAEHLGILPTSVHEAKVVRKSLDARHGKQTWRAAVRVDCEDEARLARMPGVRLWVPRDDIRYGLTDGARPMRRTWADAPWFVVGAGPAGLFAALFLAEAGAPVVLLERGGPVEDRVPAVNGYWRRKLPLDADNNLVFGEGGAGTFSDGKIYTRRRDGEVGYILRRFVDFGARSDILEEGWAHLGTDKVRAILPVFRARLRELGVEVRYHSRVDDLVVRDGRAVGVRLADGSEHVGAGVMVAPGHSARDTVRMMVRHGAAAARRPIAIGARIEHPQSLIDASRYNGERGDLPAASYRLAYHPSQGPKARTFCMCPGGMVVPAADRPERVVVNGMSFAAQRSYWANSAVIVEVQPDAYGGEGPLAGYDWQDAIEARAFEAGGGEGKAPAQRVVDLIDDVVSSELPRTSFPLGIHAASLPDVLPGHVLKGMIAAIRHFDTKLPGFLSPDALLVAPETRTTSPVRLLRGDEYASPALPGLYPVGEGAGYGGGIVSCALDGLRAAAMIVEHHGRK